MKRRRPEAEVLVGAIHFRFRCLLFLVPGYYGGMFNPLSRKVISRSTSGHFRFR